MELKAFDRDLGLSDLLGNIAPATLIESIQSLTGGAVRLVTGSGQVWAASGDMAGQTVRVPLSIELEPIAWLEGAAADERALRAAGVILVWLLKAGARYRRAADLHLETVHADYAALQEKHDALAASEARYKALSESLEAKVAEQVKTIEAAQRQLYQAEKLVSVGQLAAGVAHEINTPIGYITSNLRTGARYLENLRQLSRSVKAADGAGAAAVWKQFDMDYIIDDFQSLLKESMAGTERVARIVADLKGFSNVDQSEVEFLDVNECVRAAARIVEGRLAEHAELVLSLGTLPSISCLPGHLNQALLNILLNAAQAVGDGGRIEVLSECVGQEIRVAVKDNGCGISGEILPRIFDPFFTTRDVGQGTGLGLTVARDIIASHGGRIEVLSQPGAGSSFVVVLPVCPK